MNIPILETKADASKELKGLCESINVYQVNNAGSSADFQVLQNMVDREVQTERKKFNNLLNLPLYLGLIGTMVGIIYGLREINLDGSGLEGGIENLMEGVSLAMLASVMGLVLTVLNNLFISPWANGHLDKEYNGFFTKLEINILPSMSVNVQDSVKSLINNLLAFNQEFNESLSKLELSTSNIMNSVTPLETTVRDTAEMLKLLEGLNSNQLTDLGKNNIRILNELNRNVQHFKRFSDYLDQINSLNKTTNELISSFRDMLNRTDNFNEIHQEFSNNLAQNGRLQEHIANHFDDFIEREDTLQTAAGRIDQNLTEALEQLEANIEKKYSEFVKFLQKQHINFDTVYQDLGTPLPEHLQVLENLHQSIVDIQDNMGKIQTHQSSSQQDIENLGRQLSTSLNNMTKEMERSRRFSVTYNLSKFFENLIKPKI